MLDLNWTTLWGPHTQTHWPHRDDKLPYWPLLDSYNHKAHSVIYERDSPTPSLSLLPQKEREKERDAQDTKAFSHGTEWWYIDLLGKKIYIYCKKEICVRACVRACVCARKFLWQMRTYLCMMTQVCQVLQGLCFERCVRESKRDKYRLKTRMSILIDTLLYG